MFIIATVTNDLTYDQRMIRICTSLQQAGHEVLLVGRKRASSVPLVERVFQQKRLHCWMDKGKGFYVEYNIRLFLFLLFQRVDVICSVDLDTILSGLVVSWIRGKVGVYDAHEYFTEVPEVVRRPSVKRIWEWVARWAIPRLRYCYTVGPALAKLFTERYGTPFGVVRNVPYLQEMAIPVANFEKKVVLYQGALNEGRGLECAIEAMGYLEGVELWLAGEGDLSEKLRDLVQELGVSQKVRFLGYIQPEQLKAVTLEASVGLNILENVGLSYYYSLANKAFDYIQAGLPTIQIAFPEYQALQQQYNTFIMLEELQPEALAQTIEATFADKVTYLKLRQNCLDARTQLCWEKEVEALLQVYETIQATIARP